MKAKIVFLHKPYDLRIEEVELPELKPDEILVKIEACGICGNSGYVDASDMAII